MIQFMKLKWASLTISILVIAGSYFLIKDVFGGFREGIDFAGGIKMEITATDEVNLDSLREATKQLGITATVQSTGKETFTLLKLEIGRPSSSISKS